MFNFVNNEKFDHIFEIVVAILLGVTAVLTSYASWQSSLYGGSQATKYTEGAALQAEANSLYNEQTQILANDMRAYDQINSLRIDLAFAEKNNDQEECERLEWKLDELITAYVSDELQEAMDWADAQEEISTPFDKEGFIDAYYIDAAAMYDEALEVIESGKKDNELGDVLELTVVIFSVVLFLLGILNTFDNKKIQVCIMLVSCSVLIWAAVMMLGVPMQTL